MFGAAACITFLIALSGVTALPFSHRVRSLPRDISHISVDEARGHCLAFKRDGSLYGRYPVDAETAALRVVPTPANAHSCLSTKPKPCLDGMLSSNTQTLTGDRADAISLRTLPIMSTAQHKSVSRMMLSSLAILATRFASRTLPLLRGALSGLRVKSISKSTKALTAVVLTPLAVRVLISFSGDYHVIDLAFSCFDVRCF
ncbi:hypothetical protein F5146DRAFT_219699 [Armillaria mellea]|nr:hypothetical protein F5146DRAFT_219699 [Armillaria mellea]